MLPSVFPKKFRIIQKSQKNCVFWTLTKSDDRYWLKSLIKWKFGRFVNFCRKPHVKILKIANFPEFLKFQDHSIIQLKMAIFADFDAKYLRNGSKYCSDFWYQVKTWWEKLNYQAILSEKVWIIQKWSWIIQKFEFFKKKKKFKNFYFSTLAILSWKKGKKTMKIFFPY